MLGQTLGIYYEKSKPPINGDRLEKKLVQLMHTSKEYSPMLI